eukprot:scaffold5110_cov95-Alexandrium_tamarense.AAC.2
MTSIDQQQPKVNSFVTMRLNQATPILLGLATVPSANANRESPMTTARNDFATKLIVGLHELKEHSKAHPSRELQVDDASFITANEELQCPDTCTSQETCDYFQATFYEENNSTAFLEEACNAGFISECAPVSFETTCDMICMETDLGLVDDFTGDLICAFCNFVDCCGSEGNGDSCLGMYADALGIDAPELDDFKDDDEDNSGADNAFIGTDDGGALPTNSPTHVPTSGNVTDAPSASPSLGLTEEEPSAARSSASFSVESGLAGVILGSVVLAVGFGF